MSQNCFELRALTIFELMELWINSVFFIENNRQKSKSVSFLIQTLL